MNALRASLGLPTVMLILALHGACARSLDDVGRNPRLFTHAEIDAGEWLGLEGHWRSTTSRYSVELPRINSVAVDCWRKRMICVEHLAKLIQPGDDEGGLVKHPTLFAFGNEYRIVEWSESRLVARYEPRAADIEIRVSFPDQVVERSFRETAARGAAGAASSEVLHWLLE